MTEPTITHLINRKTLLELIPLSDRAIYDLEKRGDFPARIALTSRNVAWEMSAVEAWIQSRKAGSIEVLRPGVRA